MEIDYRRLAQELLAQKVTEKVAGTPPNFQPAHGNGGLFSQPGLEPDLYGAFVLPNYGLYARLPRYPTVFEYLIAGIVTGVTDSTGSEPTGLCDDPPYAGLMKLCQQSYPLGRFSRRTRIGEVDAFGKFHHRGENNDFTLYGNGFDSLPGTPSVNGGNPLLSETDKMLAEFAVIWSRDFAPQIWTGDPASNSAQGGTRYFYGLDTLINTGYRDTFSGVACPAADSLIRSFGDVQVQNDTAGIVNHITQMIYELWLNRASQFGLAPVTAALAMRPQLFHIITAYWACSYLSYRCSNQDTGNIDPVGGYDTTDAIAMRDAMRAGSYLLVDGKQWPVVQDDTIAETNVGAGVYESSIYFVPLTVLNGRVVTYMEYFNYDTPLGLKKAMEDLAPIDYYRTSNNGMFAWHKKPPTNWCVEAVAKTEQRLLLRTPQLAGRLTDVRYVPYVHERDWDPDGTYFADGGGISQSKSTYYSPQS